MARAVLLLEALEVEASRIESRNTARLRRSLRDQANALNLSDAEFKAHYRFSKELFMNLCTELRPSMARTRRRTKVSVECKVLTALSFYATGSYQKPVGMSYLHGLSQASVSKAVKEVTIALNTQSILRKHIRFPQTQLERNTIINGLAVCGGSLGAALVCARAPGLTERQRAMCRQSPAAVAAIGDGLRMAYAECRLQLAGRRWNCSGVGDGLHFGHVMPIGTKEAAFTYAITSAGVTHALSASCARGDLPACQCTTNRRRGTSTADQFEWGGCGEGAYGARLARRFLDARELERDARALMNLHNNRVGRKTVKELVRRECKCHGVSGSCAVRTCWRALPPFRAAAAALRERYERAKLVAPHPQRHARDRARRQAHLVLVRRQKQNPSVVRVPRKSDLVFLEPSPSYCERDDAAGSFGTHGRTCNRTSRGEDGCPSLCCGRGYSTERRALERQCRCRFHWCCRVSCDTCVARTETHVCN